MSKSSVIPLGDRLFASLSAEGVVDPSLSVKGAFTIDPDIARARIRRSRFANPVRYVLELVQAAVLKGATTISFKFGADDLHMEFDGETFSLSDFEQMYTSLLLKADGRVAQARQLLALGLCTGLQLDPAFIRVESGDCFAELSPAHEDRFGTLDTPHPRTHIRVRQKLRFDLIKRYVNHLGGHLSEEVLLQERCRYARITIELDGKLISHHHSLPDVTFWRRFASGSIAGAVGISTHQSDLSPELSLGSALGATSLVLIKSGVWVDTQLPLELLPGFRALAESASFHLDVSREHVVTDHEYTAALQQVLRAQLDLLAMLCRRHVDDALQTQASTAMKKDKTPQSEELAAELAAAPRDEEIPETIDYPHLRALLRGLFQRLGGLTPLLHWAHLPLSQFPLTELPEAHSTWPTAILDGAALLEVPILQSTTGESITLGRLLRDLADHQTVAYSALASSGCELDRPLVVHAVEAGDRELLRSLFGSVLTAYDSAIEAAREREHNMAAWQLRPHRPRLSGQVVIVRAPLHGPGITGEVGIEPHRVARAPWKRTPEQVGPTGRCGRLRFLFIKSGALLAEKRVAFPVPDLTVVVAADFTPSYRFDDVLSDARLTAVIDALFATVPALIQQIANLPPLRVADNTVPWRASVLRPLLMLALSPEARAAARRAIVGTSSSQTPTGSELVVDKEAAAKLWEELHDWPLFEALDGTPLRLRELEEAAARDGYLAVLCPAAPLSAKQLESWAALCRRDGIAESVWREAHEYSPATAPAAQRPPFVVWLAPAQRALAEALADRVSPVIDAEPWLRAVSALAALPRQLAANPASPLGPPRVLSGIKEVLGHPDLVQPADESTPPFAHPGPPPHPSLADSPEDRLVATVLEELRALAAPGPTPGVSSDRLIKNVNLAWLQIGDDPRPLAVVCDNQHFILNRSHQAVQRALRSFPDDPQSVSCLASAAYTALNARLEAATDDDALGFLHRLALRAESTAAPPATPA